MFRSFKLLMVWTSYWHVDITQDLSVYSLVLSLWRLYLLYTCDKQIMLLYVQYQLYTIKKEHLTSVPSLLRLRFQRVKTVLIGNVLSNHHKYEQTLSSGHCSTDSNMKYTYNNMSQSVTPAVIFLYSQWRFICLPCFCEWKTSQHRSGHSSIWKPGL